MSYTNLGLRMIPEMYYLGVISLAFLIYFILVRRSSRSKIVYRRVVVRDTNESPTLTMIVGPMFAGKTGEVIRRINRFKYQQMRCLIIKHTVDTRYNPKDDKQALRLTTHDYTSFSINDSQGLFDLRYCSTLQDIDIGTIQKFGCIVLEEAHMFGKDWWEFVETCLLNAKRSVIVSTIDSYAPTEPGQSPQPIPGLSQALIWSHKIIKFCSVCSKCRRPNAVFSIRTTDNKNLIDVGGAEKYQPYCIQCYVNK